MGEQADSEGQAWQGGAQASDSNLGVELADGPARGPKPADSPSSGQTGPLPDAAIADEARVQESTARRNFLVLTVYQMLMRTGWIFKTESIVMPAVLDTLGGAAWLRSCLPLLNRFGQSIPPLLAAPGIRNLARKKHCLVWTTCTMAVCFLLLAETWRDLPVAWRGWLPYLFLLAYFVFFISTGVNQLVLGTLQGKLVRTTWRGRLLWVSNLLGAAAAIGCAAVLLPRWLHADHGDFAAIFAFTGFCFLLAGASAWALDEQADNHAVPRRPLAQLFVQAWQTIAHDRNFRVLGGISALFGTSMMLFPHYQALGRQALDLPLDSLIGWVILQNAGTALFSFVAGPLADRRGNRLVLQLLLAAICAAPLLALAICSLPSQAAQWSFNLVFLMVGLTPVAIRTFNNYVLEISAPEDHPRYLSTLSVCLAAPIVLSPLVGVMIDYLGFPPVFVGISCLVLAGCFLSFRLAEPRHHP